MAKERKIRLTREESQALTRDRLMEAARTLFIGNGFGGTSVRDIAEEAGYSQGAFYSNFETKEAILLALMERHKRAEVEHLNQFFNDEGVSGEELFERLEKWVQSLDDQTEWATLAIELQLHANRSPAFSELFAVFNSKQQAQFGRLIEVLFDKHDLIPPAPPIQLARHFIALTHGLAIEEAGLVSNAILVFLRALMASAQRK